MCEAASRGPGHRKEDWIANQFRRIYDDALREGVTPEMAKLLDQLDELDDDGPADDDSTEGGAA